MAGRPAAIHLHQRVIAGRRARLLVNAGALRAHLSRRVRHHPRRHVHAL
ncbi:hypothetical protein BAE44_0012019 [Dichanthelium oligosanthes]|uniref:Uncharacterized protein n=1 Tax=Dichanthelium oligosanthes TaxID=888268 RepID=A0A1E5VPG6_9POAL|nr:hypothetical protein BAE44_0012019 [Dichanthelium oligosanthes]